MRRPPRPAAVRPHRRSGWRSPLAALTTALLAACAVGPDFHKPAPPTISRYTAEGLPEATEKADIAGGGAQRPTPGRDIPADWWALFHSPQLSRLAEAAIKANPDLDAAKAGLRVAQENYQAQKGALLPTVAAGYDLTRQQASGTPAPPLSSNVNLFTLHTAQVTVAYVPDVFGGVRRGIESAGALAESQRFQTEAVYLTLTSNLATAAIQEAALRDQIAATQAIIASASQVLHLMRRQLDLGQIAGADYAAQEAALAQAEQTLPPLQKQLAQQRDLIAYLTGRPPSETMSDRVDLASLALPGDLPLSLPSKLVEQRPDVRAAEANLHAASAQVGVAIANRLPSFQLSANAGGESTSLASLFASGNTFWALGANVTQPIFEGGALLHKQRAAEAAFDQAEAQYRSAALASFQNVADVLQALYADAITLRAAADSERSAIRSLAIAKRQLELGQVAGIAVLNAEQTYQQTVIARIQAQAGRYADTVALYQALGGGWWNRKNAL